MIDTLVPNFGLKCFQSRTKPNIKPTLFGADRSYARFGTKSMSIWFGTKPKTKCATQHFRPPRAVCAPLQRSAEAPKAAEKLHLGNSSPFLLHPPGGPSPPATRRAKLARFEMSHSPEAIAASFAAQDDGSTSAGGRTNSAAPRQAPVGDSFGSAAATRAGTSGRSNVQERAQ